MVSGMRTERCPPCSGTERLDASPLTIHRSPFCPRSEAVAQPRLAMRNIKDILRLHLVGGVSSCRQLARAAGCGKSAVAVCLRRAAEAGLDRWETIAALGESDLEQRF